MTEKMISKMIATSWDGNELGYIRFKFYGDFDALTPLHKDCKNYLFYIGNSNLDGAPIFQYNYKGLTKDILKDFKSLSIFLRGMKIKYYMNKDMSELEKSTYIFLRFFMKCCENYEVKSSVSSEIKFFNDEYDY